VYRFLPTGETRGLEAAARGFRWKAGTANAADRNPDAEGRPLFGPDAKKKPHFARFTAPFGLQSA
jgi:hypothetical protein